MNAAFHRLPDYYHSAKTLVGAGMSISSVLLYPIRRRVGERLCQLNLRNGLVLASPVDEPLLTHFQEVWVDRCYDFEGYTIAPGHVIIDIGANVGVFSAWAASVSPEVRVLALEPSPQICTFLRRNVGVNRLHNVTVVEQACGGERGEVTLYTRGHEGLNSIYCQDNLASRFKPLARVSMMTLDDVFERFELSRCDLLKLDCEGAEYEIILSASDSTLEKIARVAMEYHVGLNQYVPGDLVRRLAATGFETTCSPLENVESGYLFAAKKR